MNKEPMNKKSNMFYFALCTGLFLTGAIWSGLFSLEQSTTHEITSVISNIATTLAAIIAIATLNSWKTQFSNQKKHDALADLHSSLLGLKAIERYARAFKDHHNEKYSKAEDTPKAQSLEQFIKETEQEIIKQYKLYETQWQRSEIFLTQAILDSQISESALRDNLLGSIHKLISITEQHSGKPLTTDQWQNLSNQVNLQCTHIAETCKSVVSKGSDLIKSELSRTVSL